MPQLKCTMLLTLGTTTADGTPGRIGGWSETFYGNTTDPATKVAFEALCEKRAALLSNNAAIIGQRYQQVNPVGASSTGSARFVGRTGALPDVPQMALLCRIGSMSSNNFRPLYLRGLPDIYVKNGEYLPTDAFTRALDTYFQQLANWQFLGRTLTNPTVSIVTISETGVFQLASPLTYAENDVLQVMRTNTAFGGKVGAFLYVKTRTDAQNGAFYPANWTYGLAKGGKIRQYGFQYFFMNPTSARISRVVVKKVGRPFDQYRGRATNRR